MNVKPTKHEDGTETVTLYGKIVDVTGKDKFVLFKREYTVERDTEDKKIRGKKAKSDDR